MGLIEAPVFYFFIATTGDLDPRTIGDKDQRLKPMNVDPVTIRQRKREKR